MRTKKEIRAYAKKWYYENRDKRHEQIYKYQRGVRLSVIGAVAELLKKSKCMDCGESDPIVLEFDHVRGEKKDHVSHMIAQRISIGKVFDEIKKCEIVCCNCHRRRTLSRSKNWRADFFKR